MSAVRWCRFGTYTFDPAQLELRRQGTPVRLQDKPALVLAKLLEEPGALVTREDLYRHLWPGGTEVELDAGLNSAVRRLRDALDDSADTPRYIETMARRGYRFVAPAEWVEPASVAPPAGPSPSSPRALRWEVPVLSVAVLVLAGVLVFSRSQRSPPPDPRRVLVAVLPLTELSGDPDQQYFADGLTEELIAQLGQVEPARLGVIAQGSVLRYRGAGRSLREVGRELGVAHVIEGSLLRREGRLRLTARLVDTETETQRWSATYERAIEDVPSLQADLARAVAQEVQAPRPGGEAPRPAAPPLNPLAYDAYLKGRYFWTRRTPQDLERALTFFRLALEREPRFAGAHAGVAEAFVYRGWYGFEAPGAAFPQARAAAEAALADEPGHAGARAALGATRMLYDWDFPAGQRDFRRAIEANPSYATVHHWYGFSLAAEGRYDEALAQVREGQTLDPLSPGVAAGLAYVLLAARRYPEAEQECRAALRLDPGHMAVYKILGWIYEEQGRYDDALRTYDEGESASGVRLDADRARTLALAGRTQEARQALARVEAAALQRYVPASYLARVHVALGDTEAALTLLEKALADRAPELVHPRLAVEFAPLAREPRFQALRRRTGRE